MNTITFYQAIMLLFLAVASGQSTAQEDQNHSDWLDTTKIEQLTGVKGKLDAVEHVFKASAPRTDLKVTVAGVKMTPPLGFTSWAAFKPIANQVMVMGDIVLQEDQVNPVMSVALDNGIEVTALHNHFLWDTPKVMYMHIGGEGDLEKLAAGIGKIFLELKKTSGGKGRVGHKLLSVSKASLNPKIIETIIGVPVEKTGDIVKVTLGRPTQMHGHEIGKAMGVNTWAAFAGTDKQAIVDGDFAVLETELQSVLKVLRGAGVNITAIHSHMIEESPKIIFLHYWGEGSVGDLAKAIKSALDTQTKS